MMSTNADVIIVGGGIIGLLTARDLVGQGISVLILDQSDFGKEASWAGGGIISPLYPWAYTEPVSALSHWGQSYYPELVESLRSDTGIDPELNPCGMLMLNLPDMQNAQAWADQNHKPYVNCDADQIYSLEPNLASKFSSGLLLPYVGNVRNPRLLKSLCAFLEQHSLCELKSHSRVVDIVSHLNSADVITQNGVYLAGKVVVCSGAWTQKLVQKLKLNIDVEPVRGQMLVFEPRPGLIEHIILNEGSYLIPRLDGRIVLGSTLEYEGFDKSTTAEARETLLAKALDWIPALKEVPVEAQWAGLRPSSPAGIPYIGLVAGSDTVFVNAGHFRNGLVLAPASARLMTNLLLKQTPIVDPAPYIPAVPRYSKSMH